MVGYYVVIYKSLSTMNHELNQTQSSKLCYLFELLS